MKKKNKKVIRGGNPISHKNHFVSVRFLLLVIHWESISTTIYSRILFLLSLSRAG